MRRGLVLIVSLLAPLLAGCALNPPRIVSITPNREVTDVPSNDPITVTFDRPMNRASVERRFQLQPPLAACAGSRSCRYAWSGNTFEYLHPGINFALSTEYTVSMHAGYADESGQQNTLEHVWHFTTERAPSLSSADPADNATGVAPDRNLLLTFDRPMRPDSVHGAVTVSPDVPFLVRGRPGGDGSQYEIVPTTVLLPDTAYTVSVSKPVDVHGNQLKAPLEIHFKTGTLSLSRKIGYLIAQPDQPALGIGIVDPHLDAFLQRSTPKEIYRLGVQSQVTDTLLGFDWSPDSRRLAVIDAPKSATAGPIQIVDVATGTAIRPGISGSSLVWSPDGTIVYLSNGALHRFDPTTLLDTALTDPSDGRVVPPVAISPDGKSVAYSTIDAQALDHLWIMNVELRTRYRPIGLDDPADHPAWSPNGTKLAFRRVTSSGPELWVYDLSSSGTGAYRRVASLDVSAIAWENDNSTVIAATGSGTAASLYRVNIFSAGESGGVAKVTGVKDAPNGSVPTIPVYDRRIAFQGLVDGLPQIFVMNGDGSRPQQLTAWEADFPYTASAPNWTPSG
jgi:hypothetical protein